MNICPKCRSLYPDDFQICDSCEISLIDKKTFYDLTYELENMTLEERNKYRQTNNKYRVILKYQFCNEIDRSVNIKTPEPTPNTPKCPICNSTDLEKITAVKKAGKIAFLGIFGMGDNGKTWKCKNCGSKF